MTQASPHRDGQIPPRARALLEAVIAISSDLDLHQALLRIVTAAADLTDAQYGALGVLGPDGTLAEFITVGIDEQQRARIGNLPHGHGILGLLISRPEVLRLSDLRSHPSSAGFPDHHPAMSSFLGVPIRVRGTVFGNLYLTQKRGGTDFTVEDEVLVQGLASAAGFVVENARAYGLSERRRQWLEASAELTDDLHPPIDQRTALIRILNAARAVSGARAAAMIELPDDGEPRILSPQDQPADWVEPHIEQVRIVMKDASDQQPYHDLPVSDGVCLAVRLTAHLAAPIALVTLFDSGLEASERELLAAFADQAALALDRAQAVEDRQALAVLAERDRIGRDLHDVVIQRLYSTGITLQTLAAAHPGSEASVRLAQAVGDIDDTIKQIRSTVFSLQDAR